MQKYWSKKTRVLNLIESHIALFVFLCMIQENIKKFQKEAEKFEETSAFKSAKKQFGVFSTVKVRIDNM